MVNKPAKKGNFEKGGQMIDNKTLFQSPAIRLRVIRHALELKQITFAEYLKICPHTLRKWERNGYVLSVSYRERLRFVGINAQWLEYGTGEPFQYDLSTVRQKIIFSINNK